MTEHSRDRLVRVKLANATAAVPLFPGRLAKRIILESRYWPLTVLASHRSFPRSGGQDYERAGFSVTFCSL